MAAVPELWLGALVLPSLALPLDASARLRGMDLTRRPHLVAVWVGQAALAAAALLVLFSDIPPAAAVVAGAAGCLLGGLIFRDQCRRLGARPVGQ